MISSLNYSPIIKPIFDRFSTFTIIILTMCQNRSLFIPNQSTIICKQTVIRIPTKIFSKLCISIFLTLLVINYLIRPAQTRSHILTSNAFKGGRDIDGEKLFICRSHKYGQIIPGKYSRTIRKCSITHNRREAQFHRYEILIESSDKAYQWIELKKPVTSLPENVLFGGNKFGLPTTTSTARVIKQKLNNITSATAANFLLDGKGELNSRSVDLVISSDQIWGSRKRRIRRSPNEKNLTSTTTSSPIDDTDWSRNWRGHLYEGVERITSFTGGGSLRRRQSPLANHFNEVVVENSKKRRCTPKSNHLLLLLTQPSPADDCLDEPQKANFYIAKCSLRTGNITSEQIGKIWWKEAIQEWVASFPFAGHEVPCFDYSVLTVKS